MAMYGEDYIYYDGAFSLIIDKEINTWKDWHIFPTSRPSIVFPEMKKTTVEIPGMSGVIDTSAIFTGYPTYNNREGSIEFGIANGYNGSEPGSSLKKFNEIAEYLNGYKHIVNVDNENVGSDVAMHDLSLIPYHYEGYLNVMEYTAGNPYSTFSMEYDFDPYRYGDYSVTALKPAYYDKVPMPKDKQELTFNKFEPFCNGCPIVPLITITLKNPKHVLTKGEEITITYANDYLGRRATMEGLTGSYKYPEIILYKRYGEKVREEKKMEITVKCAAADIISTVTVDFLPGRL